MARPLPVVWGDDQLFAFSGYDGRASWDSSIVASTCTRPVGLRIRLPTRALLSFGVPPEQVRPRLVCSDVIWLETDEGDLRLAMADERTIVGDAPASHAPRLSSDADPSAIALLKRMDDSRCRWALAVDPPHAEALAAHGIDMDLSSVIEQRLAFLHRCPPPPEDIPPEWCVTLSKAWSVLKVNVYSPQDPIPCRWTTPDRWPHRHMWLWDSAFHALGWRHVDLEVAWEAIEAVLSQQGEDGFIPHIMAPGYRSRVTQPPILAWATWELFQMSHDTERLRRAYPALCRYLEWDLRHRSVAPFGLLAWHIEGSPLSRSGESGMDNSPRFDQDGPWLAVDFNAYAVSEMTHLSCMARVLGYEEEACRWAERRAEIAGLINQWLWDDERGFYLDRHADGRWCPVMAVSGFLPLWAGIASSEQADRLAAHLTNPDEFWAPFPVPSVSLSDPTHSEDMWRGSTWINMNYFVIQGLRRYGFTDLAAGLRVRTLSEIARWYTTMGGMYEFFDARGEKPPTQLLRKGGVGDRGGAGFGVICDYGWTAALFIDLIMLEAAS